MSTLSRCCKNHPWYILCAIVALTAVLFAPSFFYEYIWLDDVVYVLQNPRLEWSWENLFYHFTHSYIGLYSPLPVASFMLDFAIGGKNPFWYHVNNVVCFLAALPLLFVVLRQMRVRTDWALFLTLCFAIHPQRIESVVWIAERKDALLLLCFLGGVACWNRDRPGGTAAAWCCTALGLLCKPVGFLFPFAFYLLDVVRLRRWWRTRAEWLRFAPFAGLILVYLIGYRKLFTDTAQNVITSRPDIFLPVLNIVRYPWKIFFPLKLFPTYPYTEFTPVLRLSLALGLAAAVAGFLWIVRRRSYRIRLLPAALCFYLLLFPVLGLVVFSNAEFADRYSLLPAVVMAIALGLTLPGLRIPRKLRLAGAGGYVAVLAAMFVLYLPAWRNDWTVSAYSCDTPRPNFQALAFLANCHYQAGDVARAVGVLEHPAAQANPYGRMMYLWLRAMREAQNGNYATLQSFPPEVFRAVSKFSTQLLVDGRSLLAQEALRRGDRSGAIAQFRKIMEENPEREFIQAFYGGMIAFLQNDRAGARRQWRAAHKMEPDDEPTRVNLQRVEAP